MFIKKDTIEQNVIDTYAGKQLPQMCKNTGVEKKTNNMLEF